MHFNEIKAENEYIFMENCFIELSNTSQQTHETYIRDVHIKILFFIATNFSQKLIFRFYRFFTILMKNKGNFEKF